MRLGIYTVDYVFQHAFSTLKYFSIDHTKSNVWEGDAELSAEKACWKI